MQSRLSFAVLLCLTIVPSAIASALNGLNDADFKIVKLPGDLNVTLSYRVPDGLCTTAFSHQKQYTGWASVPGEYPTNLFFWFVEAREPSTSLTLFLNGGPGASSMTGFFAGNGPCEVTEKDIDQYDTFARQWGWDRASNMLFVDQPNHVGFSYDRPTESDLTYNGVLQALEADGKGEEDLPAWARRPGTSSSSDITQGANTTNNAAMAVWHLLQGFIGAFPVYAPPSNDSFGIHLFTESYGGVYGPVFAETFEKQNDKRAVDSRTRKVHLESVGIMNGCIDMETEMPFYPQYAANNTYGIQTASSPSLQYYADMFDGPRGCAELLGECHDQVRLHDPEGLGNVAQVNEACASAEQVCEKISHGAFDVYRSQYDIMVYPDVPGAPPYYIEYLNLDSTLDALASPVNFTLVSDQVTRAFNGTGDRARGGNIARLAALLAKGIRVGLIYGDRDYACNWFGGEAVSNSIAEAAGGTYATMFPGAGYQYVLVNDDFIGGEVRQYGNLSFTRIFNAGHAVVVAQPETAFQVFARIINGVAIANGAKHDLSTYRTWNQSVTDVSTKDVRVEAVPAPRCFVRFFPETCDADAEKLIKEGRGVVINGFLHENEEDYWRLTGSGSATEGDDPATTTPVDLTGVYTSTNLPYLDNWAISKRGRLSVVICAAIISAAGGLFLV